MESLYEQPEAQKVALRFSSMIHQKKVVGLSPEQREGIYYAAGPRFFKDSWSITCRLVEIRARHQEYVSLPPLFERLEHISAQKSSYTLSNELTWIAAIADQHSGDTSGALQRFLKIRAAAERELPHNAEHFIEACIEIGNQFLLRAEPTSAIRQITIAIDMLEDPALRLSKKVKYGLKSLAHNRYVAVLHLLELYDEALVQFHLAIEDAVTRPSHHYLLSHTHWNVASLLRFSDPVSARVHLQLARSIWNDKLPQKDRLRVMIECSEAYSSCIAHNTILSRSRLRAIAADAMEKGYLFQACDALLCLASCAIGAEAWDEARLTLLRSLDLSVMAENLRSRIFVAHYLSICAHMLGGDLECRDWCWQTVCSLTDPAFGHTTLSACLRYNDNLTAGRAIESPGKLAQYVGNLQWYPFERA